MSKKEFVIDETPILSLVDQKLENLDKSILLETRKRLLENGESIEIIDKALKNKEEKESKRKILSSIIGAVVMSGFKSDKTSPKINNDYEDYNFEEEELEDDDYYSEDDLD